ncbi:S-adenosyl-L-methionine-dependent methyltransferase [Rhypophila sp. PSN 637]
MPAGSSISTCSPNHNGSSRHHILTRGRELNIHSQRDTRYCGPVHLILKSEPDLFSKQASKQAALPFPQTSKNMDSISTGPIASLLEKLHQEAEAADKPLMERYLTELMKDTKETDMDQAEETDFYKAAIDKMIQSETKDLGAAYSELAGNFLSVSPQFGRFLYACARAARARHIVEFGSSMGVSTIYLAAALRDNNNNSGTGGAGVVIGTELEPSKAARAMTNLSAAGLADLVQIRVGDARETLAAENVEDEIDMVLLDGAFTLYLDVLKVIEPRLRPGALVIGENCFRQAGGYVDYVNDPSNGYLSVPLPFDAATHRGNLLSVRTAKRE